MGSCLDLRKYQEAEAVEDAFSKVVSGGKLGYKSVIERKKPAPKCSKCGRGGEENQKFCSQCGGKMVIPLTKCPTCKKSIEEHEKFCTECGCDLVTARVR